MSGAQATQVTAEIVVATGLPDTPAPVVAPVLVAQIASAPAVSLRASVVRSAWRDLRRFLTLFFACTTAMASYHLVRLEYGDVRDYSTYVETVGPVAVVDDGAGNPSPGPPQVLFHPGERVGWLSNFCVKPGNPYTAYASLVMMGGPNEGITVDSRVHRVSGDVRRCGPLFGFLTLPADAASADYQGRRWGIFRDGSWWPLRFDFPPFWFKVTAWPSEGGKSTDRATENP